MKYVLLLIALAVSGDPSAWAGAGQTIVGVVRDEGGGRVVGASVVATTVGGSEVRIATDAAGRFRLEVPASADVTVRIDAPGFVPFQRVVKLSTGTSSTLDVKLRLATAQTVDVHSGLLNLSLAADQNLSNIFLTGRNLDALPQDPEGLLQSLRMLAATRGGRPDQVVIYVDGAPLDRRLPPKDAILSIRINANPFSAEFPEPGASRVEITTKPAAEKVHGNARFDFNDSVLNARNLFEPTRAPLQLRTYTGYVGGPLVKDRWGLVAYGGLWDQDENAIVNVPTIDANSQRIPLRLNVSTPIRTLSYSVKTDISLGSDGVLVVDYGRDRIDRTNAGLQSGLDLPERAFSGTSTEDTLRSSLTSTLSARLLNEFRVAGTVAHVHDAAVTSAPAVVVLGAFNAGGNQDAFFRDSRTHALTVRDVLTFGVRNHVVRAGGHAGWSRVRQNDRANFNGTFVFGTDVQRDFSGNPIVDPDGSIATISGLELYQATIARRPGYGPSQFSIVRGEPKLSVPLADAAWFIHDDWRASPRVTISLGLRHEYQANLNGDSDLAPRAAVAWAPSANGRTTVRVGAGVFYTRVPTAVFTDVARLNGRRAERVLIDRPSGFPMVPELVSGTTVGTIATRVKASDLTAPLSFVRSISVDQQLIGNLFGSVGYTQRTGKRLLRTRSIGWPALSDQTAALAPVLQFESTGKSHAHEFFASANGAIGSRITLFGSYAWTSASQDTDTLYTAPADSSNLDQEWGRAPRPRHQISLGGSVTLPGGIGVSPLLTGLSSLPFDITTGRDRNGDSLFTERPALARAGEPGAIATRFGAFRLDPAASDVLIPRNFGDGPRQITLDLSVARSVTVRADTDGNSHRATFAVSISNVTNRVNYAPFDGVLQSPFFGGTSRALNPRRVTLFAQYQF